MISRQVISHFFILIYWSPPTLLGWRLCNEQASGDEGEAINLNLNLCKLENSAECVIVC